MILLIDVIFNDGGFFAFTSDLIKIHRNIQVLNSGFALEINKSSEIISSFITYAGPYIIVLKKDKKDKNNTFMMIFDHRYDISKEMAIDDITNHFNREIAEKYYDLFLELRISFKPEFDTVVLASG